jgi:hypothetical protein
MFTNRNLTPHGLSDHIYYNQRLSVEEAVELEDSDYPNYPNDPTTHSELESESEIDLNLVDSSLLNSFNPDLESSLSSSNIKIIPSTSRTRSTKSSSLLSQQPPSPVDSHGNNIMRSFNNNTIYKQNEYDQFDSTLASQSHNGGSLGSHASTTHIHQRDSRPLRPDHEQSHNYDVEYSHSYSSTGTAPYVHERFNNSSNVATKSTSSETVIDTGNVLDKNMTNDTITSLFPSKAVAIRETASIATVSILIR